MISAVGPETYLPLCTTWTSLRECLEELQQTPGVWVPTLHGRDVGKMAGRDPHLCDFLSGFISLCPRDRKRERGHWGMRMELVPQRWREPISW